MIETIKEYTRNLQRVLETFDGASIQFLAEELQRVWDAHGQVFCCGNGGSAANSNHAVNDLIYGLDPTGKGMRAHSLNANASVSSCLANDTGYANVFVHQLRVLGQAGDLLMVFSGSGNSENVLNAIHEAKSMGITTAGVLGFDGGKAKALLDIPIHFPVMDMQISEDLQMIVVHMIVRYLKKI